MKSIDRLSISSFLLVVFEQVSAIYSNQPKFCPNASWNLNGSTLANSSLVGNTLRAFFINTTNTILIPGLFHGRILICCNKSVQNDLSDRVREEKGLFR